METKIKFSYPSSEKVYLSGKLYPEIKVGMRRVRLTPTVTFEGEKRHVEENKPVYIYDTSGPYVRLSMTGASWADPYVLRQAGHHHAGDGVCCHPREHELRGVGHQDTHHTGICM